MTLRVSISLSDPDTRMLSRAPATRASLTFSLMDMSPISGGLVAPRAASAPSIVLNVSGMA